MNALPGVCGWFTENYGGGVNDLKKPFQRHNTERLDAIRNRIDELSLDWEDKCVVLTSLMFALDSVDSTLGHYAAYLSNWSPRSFNKMILRLPRRFKTDQSMHTVLRMDIFEAIRERSFDVAYFDPPYGSNNEKMPPSRVRYGAYYHLWKTVVLNDRPKLFGKAGRREDSRDELCHSLFEEYRKDVHGRYIAIDAIDRLIREVQADYVLLSYSSGGRATKQELMDSLSSNGTIETIHAIDYKKKMSWLTCDGRMSGSIVTSRIKSIYSCLRSERRFCEARHEEAPRQPAQAAAVRVLRRVRGLRRNAVRQAAHPDLRRQAPHRERDGLLVDLRRQPADHPVLPAQGRTRPGVEQLALRGQRAVRHGHARLRRQALRLRHGAGR